MRRFHGDVPDAACYAAVASMTRKKRLRRELRRAGGVARVLAHEIPAIRAAGRFAAELLDLVEREIRPGMTTAEIDRLVDEATRARGAVSAPYGYGGFPGHCCTSLNNVVCHGIPSPHQALRTGDIINVDVTPIVDGFHGDASRTFCVGEVAPAARRLVEDTYEALWRGIRAVRPGGHVGDIGYAIQTFAEARGYSVVREFAGHGIGRVFHTAPTIYHFGEPGAGERLLPGMTFTVEPMINLGHWRVRILEDGWTAVTADGALSAQFEHTILVTDSGAEVVTLGTCETSALRAPITLRSAVIGGSA
jgi:methionyl aminopeptidase